MTRRIGDFAKLCYPVIQLVEGLGIEPVHALPARLLAENQSGPAQYPQVLRYGRLADPEGTAQVVGRMLRIAQQIQDRPARGVRHSPEYVRSLSISHSPNYISKLLYVKRRNKNATESYNWCS